MQILSDYNYRILSKLKCKLHVILVLLLHKVHYPVFYHSVAIKIEIDDLLEVLGLNHIKNFHHRKFFPIILEAYIFLTPVSFNRNFLLFVQGYSLFIFSVPVNKSINLHQHS